MSDPRYTPQAQYQTTKTSTSSQSQPQRRSSGLYYSPMVLYFIRHLQACVSSLGRMSLTPIATLLTIAVIGVSMALPAGLLILLKDAQGLLLTWQSSTDISVFLKVGTPEAEAESLLSQIKLMPMVRQATYISPEEGLQQFEKTADFNNILSALPSNPLPPVIEIEPMFHQTSNLELSQLIESIKQLPNVDVAQFDTQWVQRLYAIVTLVRRSIWALSSLLALGVMLVIGNTIRLLTQNRQYEIEVLKLVGASNAFVRRPFLYSGLLYGMFGAITAWFFVDVILLWLRHPMAVLAELYQSDFAITGMPLSSVLLLLLLGGALGISGAYLAVNRHINAMKAA